MLTMKPVQMFVKGHWNAQSTGAWVGTVSARPVGPDLHMQCLFTDIGTSCKSACVSVGYENNR